MKAIQIQSYGHSEVVRVSDAPTPHLKSGEVLVRIRAAGVNPVDWKIREGFLKDVFPKSFPLTLGQDFSGEVVEVGPDITDFKVGDAVFGFARGSYAEYAAVSATQIVKKPTTIDFVAAAAVPTPGLTAYQIVVKIIELAKGQSVLIQGAAGGVGSIATQLAVSRGARVFATASSKDTEYLKELGVREVIDFKSERFENKIRDVDAVIDLVGGEVLTRSLQVVKPGGILVTTVGPIDETQASTHKVREVRTQHVVMSPNAADLAEIANLIDRGVIKIRVAQVLPLTQAKEALDSSQSGRSHGKLILKVA